MAIDTETVKHVANLARINITDEELVPLSEELSTILKFMEQLNSVDVDGIDPLTSVTPMALNLRDDIVDDGEKPNQILMNAPNRREGFFTVPKVIEQKMGELSSLTISKAQYELKKGNITSVELTEDCLIEAKNSTELNAFCMITEELALHQAMKAD